MALTNAPFGDLLAALELRLSLLDERREPLVGVFGGAGDIERASLEVDTRVERRFEGVVDPFFRKPHRHRALRRDLGGHRLRFLEPCLLRNDPGNETELSGLLRGEHPPAQDHVHRHCLADGAGQALRAARAGHHTEIDLRLSELRRFCCDDQVANHGELAAAAEAETGNRRNERRAQPANRIPAIDASLVVERYGRPGSQLSDVCAGRKGPFVSAQDDAAQRVVGVQPAQRVDELFHQLARQRVQLLRPVEEHDRDPCVIALYEDERFRNAFTASCASSPSIESASQSRAWFTVSCQERSRQKFNCCFAYRVVCGSFAASFATYSSTAPSISAAGSARLIRPHSSACRAVISSLSMMISRALPSPTKIGSHCVAPPAGTEPCSRPTCRMNAS